jgi:hypothetical protein
MRVISGPFFRSIPTQWQSALLDRQQPLHVGRYHGPGQHALYMSATAEWARLVAEASSQKDGHSRILFPLEISEARVLDLGDEAACRQFGIDGALANLSWQKAIAAGETPPSWIVANAVRATGADGLIDRSRSFPGAWHVTLFDWNMPGKPQVRATGDGELLGWP